MNQTQEKRKGTQTQWGRIRFSLTKKGTKNGSLILKVAVIF